jgi:phosphoribosylanthranilate isomerase
MTMRSKICGIRSEADLRAAVAAGADAIGFISGVTHVSEDALDRHRAATLSAATPPCERAAERSILAAVHVTGPEAVDAARAVAPYCDAVLLDSRTSDRLGGTGRPHDWSISAAIVDALAGFDRPVVLAGGLTPATVAAAIRQVRPYAVDVNSGVETAGGDKDPAACAAFVAAARSMP